MATNTNIFLSKAEHVKPELHDNTITRNFLIKIDMSYRDRYNGYIYNIFAMILLAIYN